mgnify:CR=1 FL=1|tara:strand:- start:8397 stop:9071 length:675 start_codon:yes stop_codon:yes gene_type:complete
MWNYSLLILCVIYALFYFLWVSKSVGIWLSILTHAFALPVIYADFPNILSVSTSLTVLASLLFHILNDGYDLDEDKEFRRFDHGWSVFLIYLITFKVAYKKIPEWGMIILLIVTSIPIAFLTNPRTYIFLAVAAFVIMAVLLYRKYNIQFMLSFTLLMIAVSSRYWPILDNKYHRHSVWHALVFTSVFYAHCGILLVREKEKEVEIDPSLTVKKKTAYKQEIKF